MPRLVGVHQIVLKEGVTPEDFESFARNESKLLDLPGWRYSIAKGDRGRGVGDFVGIFETDVASRDRVYPGPTGEMSEEAKTAYEAISTPEEERFWERWRTLVVQPTALTRNYTDYVVIAESQAVATVVRPE
jgi:hypothetical protein